MAATEEVQVPVNKNKKYRKPKPWDTDDIDHWKMEEFKVGDMSSHLLEESSFATLFPKYREKYLQQVWPNVVSCLKEFGVHALLDLIEGSMTVKTTRKTWDPYMIVKARDMIKLLARSVPFEQAKRVLQDEMTSDIIKIGNVTRNMERFVKRRQRLVGPNGNTLKALELLTECYIKVQGSTVAALGPYKGIKQARNIVMDTMNNIHPIYNIKILMTKRELMKDPALKNESWDRFLPQFKKKNVQTKKPKKTVVKKKYTPFPPPQPPSKVDLQLESGEYFMKEDEKKQKKHDEKEQKTALKTAQKRKEREEVFVAPKEDNLHDGKAEDTNNTSVDIEALKNKLRNKNLKMPKIPQKEIEDSPAISTESSEVPKKKKKKTKLNSDSVTLSQDNNEDTGSDNVTLKRKKKKKVTSDVAEPTSDKPEESSVNSGKKRKKSKDKIVNSENVEIDATAPKKKKKVKKEIS